MTAIQLTENGNTLQSFLSISEADLSKGLTGEVLRDAARGDTKEFADWVSSTKWTGMPTELAHRLVGFLQNDPAGVFVDAWARCAALRKCAEESRAHPDDTTSVFLTSHDFTYQVKPTIDVLLDGVRIGAFPFTASLTCEVSALELQIKDGEITAVQAGTADCKAQIACAASTIWHNDLARVNLPGRLQLKKPLRI
jgi:hypothetical protein